MSWPAVRNGYAYAPAPDLENLGAVEGRRPISRMLQNGDWHEHVLADLQPRSHLKPPPTHISCAVVRLTGMRNQ